MIHGIATVIDELAAGYSVAPWALEIEQAREEHDQQRGKAYEDDELFEMHLAAFLEWYVLERPLRDGLPPVLLTLRQGATLERAGLLRALALSYRSVFEVVDRPVKGILLSDLILDGLWLVDQDPPLDGIDHGDIFEARLIPWQERVSFGPVFCFHPRPARESIHALVRQAEEREGIGPEMVFQLAQMRLKYDRFRNIAVEHIYVDH
jgi:hypothetical protein